MAATTAPFGVLPVLTYALAALLLVYLGLRLARHLKSRHPSALPKPVSGGASSKSLNLLGGARSTASGWRRWSQSLPLPALPQVRVPWVRIPSLSESGVGDKGAAGVGAAQAQGKTKNGKNLAIDLLPTTGLPPPPSSAPIFAPTPTRASTPALRHGHPHQHQQLVDISSPPSTPGLTTASTPCPAHASPAPRARPRRRTSYRTVPGTRSKRSTPPNPPSTPQRRNPRTRRRTTTTTRARRPRTRCSRRPPR
ncbi:hypothetical protein BJ912DRAFT_409239 [Pholiota molesta]|nr:hypothetical protein BJ912DRAFT_409239 [Pholiota molesta]